MAKENVIYISTHALQMVSGSCDKDDMIKIFDFHEIALDEGTMINGVIMEETPIVEALKVMKTKGVKQARLVIDSGQILIRNMVVPLVSKKELLHFIVDELSNINESYEDLVYDYSVLRQSFLEGETNKGEILCCGVERKLLTNYIEVFDSAGIKLKSIDISVNALQKFTQELNEFVDRTYIISVLDANNVTSYLFENNCYVFSHRARLFSDRGSEELQSEMSSSISQLIQFNKSKRSPYTIQTAYFCGLQPNEEMGTFENIRKNLNISAQRFPESTIVNQMTKNSDTTSTFELHNYVFPVGCLIRK